VLSPFPPPPFTLEQILKWADAFYLRSFEWPHFNSGPVTGTGGETWSAVDAALRHGFRGLPGGSSLARLLALERGVKHKSALSKLNVRRIRDWAENHLDRTGLWPDQESGRIPDTEETWKAIEAALRLGLRGLRGGSSLSQLLFTRKKTRRKATG
jgi:hypothetical protein